MLNISIYVLNNVNFFKKKNLHLLGHTSVSTMDRLLIPDLLKSIDKALYFDTDTIFHKDIRSIFEIEPLNGIAARPSSNLTHSRIFSLISQWTANDIIANKISEDLSKKLKIKDINPQNITCFNAGILLMDTMFLRSNNFLHNTKEWVDKYQVNDQLALNLYATGIYTKLPPEWNHYIGRESIEAPYISHYVGNVKPWSKKLYTKKRCIWLKNHFFQKLRTKRLHQPRIFQVELYNGDFKKKEIKFTSII